MTPEEQRKAELDAIDKKRREKEALLLLLLIGFYDQGRRFASASIRTGHDPLPAVQRAFTGNGTPHFPGVATRLANGLADIDLTARTVASEGAAKANPLAAQPREADKPTTGTKTTPGAPESQPAAKGGADGGAVSGKPAEPTPPKVPQPAKQDIAKGYKAFAEQTADEMRQNVSALVQDILDHAKDVPTSIATVITTMREAFAAKGWTLKNPSRAKAQAITLAARAWAAGSFAGIRQPGVWNAVQAFRFLVVHNSAGKPDERVCPVCKPLDGVTLHRDDPRWTYLWTPRHTGCRCLVRPVFTSFTPSVVPDNLPPAQATFGVIPSLAPGYTALGTL